MADTKIGITINVQAAQAMNTLTRFTQQATAQLQKFQKSGFGGTLVRFGKAFESLTETLAPLKAGLATIAAAFAAIGAAGALAIKVASEIISKFAEWTKSAMEVEAIERRAVAALNTRVTVTSATVDALKAYNQELQRGLGLSADTLLQLQGTLAALGVLPSEMQRATEATIGLSQATGMELAGASRIVAKVMGGNIDILKRYNIQALDVDDAMAQLADKFRLAQAQSGSLETKVNALSESWGDLGEELGKFFTESGVLKGGVDLLRQTVDLLVVATVKSREWFDSLTKVASGLVEIRAVTAAIGLFKDAIGDTGDTSTIAAVKLKQLITAIDDEKNGVKVATIETSNLTKELDKLAEAEGKRGVAAMAEGWKKRIELQRKAREEMRKERERMFQEMHGATVQNEAEGFFGQTSIGPAIIARSAAIIKEQGRIKENLDNADKFRREEQKALSEREIETNEVRFQLEVAQFDARQKLLKKQQAQLEKNRKATAAFSAELVTGLVGAILSGQKFSETLKRIGEQLLAMALNQIIKSFFLSLFGAATGGIGGLFGGIAGLFGHDGGRVPGDLKPMRFAAGGTVPNTGTDRDVFPALLRRGERVLTPEEQNQPRGGTTIINVPLQTFGEVSRAEWGRSVRDRVLPGLERAKKNRVRTNVFNRTPNRA